MINIKMPSNSSISDSMCECLKKQSFTFCFEKEDDALCKEALRLYHICIDAYNSKTNSNAIDRLPDISFDIYKKSH